MSTQAQRAVLYAYARQFSPARWHAPIVQPLTTQASPRCNTRGSSLYAIFGKIVASQSGRVVEGAARMADAGGATAIFLPLLRHLPEGALARGAQIAGVAPASLGAGYVAFFFYSIAIGGVAILLAFLAIGRTKAAGAAR